MLGKLLIPEIEELVRNKQFRELKGILQDLSPADLADIISDMEESELVVVFRLLSKEMATEVFEYLDFEHQATLLNTLKKETIRHILEDMSPDDRTALLEELPPKVCSQLLALLSADEREVAQTLLNYPEQSVGRLMTPDFVYLKPDMTVEQALAKIRRIGIDRETVYALYVVDEKRKMLGAATLRRLVTAPLDTKVVDIMYDDVPRVTADTDREKAAEILRHYDLIALPVIDSDGRLVGIVTVDDVLDVLEAEHTEDVQLQAAILPDEESYLKVTVWNMVKRRVVWLFALLLAETGAVLALKSFEAELTAVIALASFLPVMVATGGNTGTQSAALVIRALATGEVEVVDALKVLWRDVLVGLCLAGLLGVFAFFIALLVNGDTAIGICVAIGLAVIVVMSNLCGTLFPLLFKKLNMDPALMSGPFISTMVDVSGLVIYLKISFWILDLMR